MTDLLETIPLSKLLFAFVPVLFVVVIIWKWQLGYKNSIYAISRMLLQLLLIGYVLAYIFETNSSLVVIAVLSIMLFASSWIALTSLELPRRVLLSKSFTAIFLSGSLVLSIISQGVLDLQPWYEASVIIPLAGMVFASAMNSVSLAGERLKAELDRNVEYDVARNIAMRTSLIPITNSLFAVGLVSLPGMMTGQILAGVSPLVAARYQIMVMCMLFGAAGIASALFLVLVKPYFQNKRTAIND